MAVVFAEEKSETCLVEIAALASTHMREARPHDAAPDLDVEKYLSFERAGILIVVTARDAGILVGYAPAVVFPQLQNRGVLAAQIDGVWLASSHRRPRVLPRMIHFLEASLRARGVVVCGAGAQRSDHALARMLQSLGYDQRAVYYERRL